MIANNWISIVQLFSISVVFVGLCFGFIILIYASFKEKGNYWSEDVENNTIISKSLTF